MTSPRHPHQEPARTPLSGSLTATHNPVLVADGVTKTYRRGRETVHALGGVDLQVYPGEVVVLIGRSGSGKTTLLNCVAGWETPNTGTITVTNSTTNPDSTGRRTRTPWQTIAVVPQRFGLLDELTLTENVALPARLAHLPGADGQARQLLTDLGLGQLTDRLPIEVSLGEAQRATLARALVVRPALLLADEPTGRLDEVLSEHVLAQIRHRCHTDGTAAVIASHDVLATKHADRVVRLHDGLLTTP